MKEKDEAKLILTKTKIIRNQTKSSSLPVQNYLRYQQLIVSNERTSVWSCNKCFVEKLKTDKQFRIVYNKMGRLEKVKFYAMNVKLLRRIMDEKNNQKQGRQFQQKSQLDQIEHYQLYTTKALLRDKQHMKKWTEVTLQIYQKEKFIKVKETKEDIQLIHYIVRRSRNKQHVSLVIETSSDQIASNSFYIHQSSMDFQDLDKRLAILWEESQYDKIRSMLGETEKPFLKKDDKPIMEPISPKSQKIPQVKQLPLKTGEGNKENGLMDILSKMKNNNNKKNTLKIDKTFLTDDFLNELSSFGNFEEKNPGLYLQKGGKKVRKIFNFSNGVSKDQLLQVIDDIRHIRKRKQKVSQLRFVRCLPEEEVNFYQEVDRFRGQQVEFIYFRHYFTRQNYFYFVEKSTDVPGLQITHSKGEINYCIWRVRNNNGNLQLLVEADITHTEKQNNSQLLAIQYIGEFKDYITNKFVSQAEQSDDSFISEDFQNEYLSEIVQSSVNSEYFYTVSGSYDTNLSFDLSQNNKLMVRPQDISLLSENIHIKNSGLTTPNTYQHKYILSPLPKSEPKFYKSEVGHIIMGQDWKVNEQGSIVNINIQKIQVQSSVLKLVFKRMGRNLLSGKSVLNMSLPVQVFNTQSNIETLAKGYKYAPRFFQQAANLDIPLQRLKKVVCFALGTSLSYIHMEKPFNPILGQTYQCLIDGCPVYGQQTSHHPPISSLYMVGRGYILYGNFQAKVDLGVNSASGVNDGFNNLIFDKYEGVVRFNGATGELSGLILGQRKIHLSKKTYYIDEHNRLFLEISWGMNKNGRKGYGNFLDYFSGKIVRIKQGVNIQDYKKIKKIHYESQLGEIYGRTSIGVFFENQSLYSVETHLPYAPQDYVPALVSDARERQDLIMRRANDYNRAQQAKQMLEELQRNDRKLRKQLGPKK